MLRTAIYYGWTPTGKRIHLGDETRVIRQKSARITIVDTFCSATMNAWEDGSMPPQGRVQEFCRNCFRTLAWDIFEQRMLTKSRRKEAA